MGPRGGLIRGLSHGPKNGTTLTYWQEESLISIVKVKETLLIKDLKHTLNENISSEKLYLYKFACLSKYGHRICRCGGFNLWSGDFWGV